MTDIQLGEEITWAEAKRRGRWIHVYIDAEGIERRALTSLEGPEEPIGMRKADKPLRIRSVGIFAVPEGISGEDRPQAPAASGRE
jgi:hypothetical protein